MDVNDPQALARAWRSEMEAFYRLWAAAKLPPEKMQSFTAALAAFRTEQAKLLREALFRKVLSVEYNYERPADQATLSNVRLLLQTPLGSKPKDKSTKQPPWKA